MEAMARESWTDERLDDLKEDMNGRLDKLDAHMTEGFGRLDSDIRELRKMALYGFISMVTITTTCFVGLASLIAF
jgi:hypothetical protein